jgi:hypothetical protein
MVEQSSIREVYQLHVWLREITPLIWRRLVVRSDSTIADLHDTPQIAMGWDDAHLPRLRIRGKDYGRLCRKFYAGGAEGAVALVREGIRRPGRRTARLMEDLVSLPQSPSALS